eukprot:scaffold3361_cov153-Isochrysis_galbana.AAC.3
MHAYTVTVGVTRCLLSLLLNTCPPCAGPLAGALVGARLLYDRETESDGHSCDGRCCDYTYPSRVVHRANGQLD